MWTRKVTLGRRDEEDEDAEGSAGLRKFGHSKNGTWSPQIVVALAVTRDGLPVRSWVLPGNTSEFETIKRVRADLRGWKLGRALFVSDSGMNSRENRDELARACGKYLLATRMGSVSEVKEEVLARAGRFKVIAENLHAKEVTVGNGELRRRYIICYNPREAERQRKHREQVVKELEQELDRHPDHTATARWAIDLLASGRYKRYLTTDDPLWTMPDDAILSRQYGQLARMYVCAWMRMQVGVAKMPFAI